MENLTNTLSNTLSTDLKLFEWQARFDDAKNRYYPVVEEILDNREAYNGTRAIKSPTGRDAKKQTSNVRKVCFELIEAQIDSNIPMPKVMSKDGYENQAMTIEMFLKNELDRLPIENINDLQSRMTPIDGGSVFFLEWDNSKNTRTTNGEINIKNIDATQVIPQPGVHDIEEMDYIFLTFEQTKAYILDKFGVDVEDENNIDDTTTQDHVWINEDLLVHVYCFYRNTDGKIGLISWVGDTIIQDYPNYFGRQKKVCSKCGLDKQYGENKCECGNETFKLTDKKIETLTFTTTVPDPMTGQPVSIDKTIEVPYYVPDFFPIVIRKNVSKLDSMLGLSDITFIKDQQNDLNIYSAKVKEKLLKGGSIVLKPKNINFKASDEELKIVEIDNPSQMGMFDVRSIQPDVSRDLNMLEMNYMIARQTIGITDSYQGRQDQTATSGRAKEIAAAQSAGRLVSKRQMKDTAFAKLYEYMFKFLLAYADEPRSYVEMDSKGEMIYKKFDKKDFILQDSAGEFYYNDQFTFSTDVSSTLSNNRESMWQETRMNFQTGAYGNPQDLGTLTMFWQTMNMLHYPGAKQALTFLEQRRMEAEMIRQQEMIAQNIADRQFEQVQTRNKMNELGLQNQISQLQGRQGQQGPQIQPGQPGGM